MSRPPAIYWSEKAKLCERAFIQQIQEGNDKEAIKNLFRMSHALNMRDLMIEEEGK